MTDVHILIYGALAFLVILLVLLFYKEIQVMTFDRDFAKTLGVKTFAVDIASFVLIVLAVVIGIRSVGVVLMSAMLIAPASAARQFSNTLYKVFFLAALFGLISGFFGNYLSMEGTLYLMSLYPDDKLALPTGPMIVLVASSICLLALLLAPERGLVWRFWRIATFRFRCLCENVLKEMWRAKAPMSFDTIGREQTISSFYLHFLLWRLVRQGWVIHVSDQYELTHEGKAWAANIVRLHRLWEVYLVDYLGSAVERVHRSAEEMEHIITPGLEKELTELLADPKRDPHHQPIPPKQETLS